MTSALRGALPWWERATVRPEECGAGWLAPRWLTPVTLGLALLLGGTLGGVAGWGGVLLGVVLARLVAMDLVYEVLPDVYTLPLLAVAAVHALGQGRWGVAVLGVGVLVAVMQVLGRMRLGIGGGDLKLMAAMLVGLGPLAMCAAVLAGCLLWLGPACWRPRAAQPFGVPLVGGFLAVALGCGIFCARGGLAEGWLTTICLLCN